MATLSRIGFKNETLVAWYVRPIEETISSLQLVYSLKLAASENILEPSIVATGQDGLLYAQE